MAIAAPTIAVDHVTASVIQGALENIAVEMGYKLMRMSYSSIIRERATATIPRCVSPAWTPRAGLACWRFAAARA